MRKKNKMTKFLSVLTVATLVGSSLTLPFPTEKAHAESISGVAINEVAWMGTTVSYNDEWIELYNDSNQEVDLTGWTLSAKDGTPAISLSGKIPAKGYYLLERTDDNTVTGVTADLIYAGALGNTNETLELKNANGILVDTVGDMYAGDNTTKATMERINPITSGSNSSNWTNGTKVYAEGIGTPKAKNTASSELREVVISEIAWMGTNVSYSDEWIELYNNSSQPVDLTNWVLKSEDGAPAITLQGTIPAQGHFLLEKTDDNSVTSKVADQIYSGSLDNTVEVLTLVDANGILIDKVDKWYAGDNTSKATMERVNSNDYGTLSTNWKTATTSYADAIGSPKNSLDSSTGDTSDGYNGEEGTDPVGTTPVGETNVCGDTAERINNVSEELGAINVYFNKCAMTQYAQYGNEANYNVNFEDRLIKRLNQAQTSIDLATYEINLGRIIDTLINKAAEGVKVRVVADAKDSSDPHYAERYEEMRLYIEKLVRGKDGIIGTQDDVKVMSDSIMFAVEDSVKRTEMGLPSTPNDFSTVTVLVGNTSYTGYKLVEGEYKSEGTYYGPGNQMHNKFAIIDNTWVFTGTWNFTVTGLYGTEDDMLNGRLNGNQNQTVEIHWPEIANTYTTEFNEMWGGSTTEPNAQLSNFNTHKIDNTQHVFDVNGKKIEVYFSSGDNALGRMKDVIKNEAQYNSYFSIFAWSDQSLVDELKYKWEGSYNDLEGTKTGFDIKGLFDPGFYTQWWSANVDMLGQTASQTSVNNPNTRWANPAPVLKGKEARKLHSKTMLIDADTNSDPTVIIGSTNWSNNGNNVNDENMLIIHDAKIANQFVQEFNARYINAGGTIQ